MTFSLASRLCLLCKFGNLNSRIPSCDVEDFFSKYFPPGGRYRKTFFLLGERWGYGGDSCPICFVFLFHKGNSITICKSNIRSFVSNFERHSIEMIPLVGQFSANAMLGMTWEKTFLFYSNVNKPSRHNSSFLGTNSQILQSSDYFMRVYFFLSCLHIV